MKIKGSQILLRASKKQSSSTKQLVCQSTASDSLKAPKRRLPRKSRKFGDDITNILKQPVFQPMQIQQSEVLSDTVKSKISQIAPYFDSIDHHLRLLDAQFTNSILLQLSIKNPNSTEVTLDMRKILIRWILQVGYKFQASAQTIQMCVQIIDYILVFSHQKINKANFQLLGVAALFVASKYNEVYTRQAKKYVHVCDGLYTREDLFEMQSYILTVIKFNLQLPNICNFLAPFVSAPDATEEFKKTLENVEKMVLLDFNLFNKYKKLDLACGMVYFSCKILNCQKYPSKYFIQKMNINEDTFKSCCASIFQVYKQLYKPNSQNQQNKE